MGEFMQDIWQMIADPTWRTWVGGALCLIASVSTVIAAVGVLRFPDFYTRMHAASVTDTLGALVLILGMAFLAPNGLIVLKLVLIGLFLVLTSPTSSHAIANAAYTAGLQPKLGRYSEMETVPETTDEETK
ncbi:monovalent cation/H(+) antiporter subunit G [Ponticaulis profundi]|uniref:Monovalent cation/H(+) antiporter subunit G n=1 Tax=Ponticaulis profundi TaxID=2665222 RepID=A0ABW1S4Z8_9PROT